MKNATYIIIVLLLVAIKAEAQYQGGNEDGFSYNDCDKRINNEAPTIISPENDSEISTNIITFKWQPVNRAISYIIQVSTNNDFSALTIEEEVRNTEYIDQTAMEYNVHYYWRVKTKYMTEESDWSEIRNITKQLNSPDLISPMNNAEDVSRTVTLEWEDVDEADSYYLLLSTNGEGYEDDTVISEWGIEDNSYQIPQNTLYPKTTYYWAVKSLLNDVESEWSEMWSFTTAGNTENFNKLSYQGVLLDNENEYITGVMQITFKIYTDSEGAMDPVWTETQTVTVYNGLINVILGSENPLALSFDTSYWIGMTINDDEELRPLSPLVGNIYKTGFGR
jgi:hypothetical protein